MLSQVQSNTTSAAAQTAASGPQQTTAQPAASGPGATTTPSPGAHCVAQALRIDGIGGVVETPSRQTACGVRCLEANREEYTIPFFFESLIVQILVL